MPLKPLRLAYLVSHPIQYQAPLLRLVASEPGVDFKVFFCSDISVKPFRDVEFGVQFRWDVPLLDGYAHEFLPAWNRTDYVSQWKPLNHGLGPRLRAGNFDVLWVHGYARPFNLWAMTIARRLGLRVFLRDEATLVSARRGLLKQFVKKPFMTALRGLVDSYLAIGSMNREYYRWHGVPAEKIFDVPYCVDNAYFGAQAAKVRPRREQLRDSLALKPGVPIFLFASKMIPRKRAVDLLEAFISLSPDRRLSPEAYLLFIGDGESRRDLETRARRVGWEAIRFLGFKNQSELPAFYDLCDVFVLPSVCEPWGLVVNEVMNIGKPVIVSNEVGAGRDLVTDGVNGYVFPARQVGELAKALRRFIVEPGLSQRMGAKSFERIRGWSFEQDLSGLRAALMEVRQRDSSSRG